MIKKSPFIIGLFIAAGMISLYHTAGFIKHTFFKKSAQEQKMTLLEIGFTPHLTKTQTPFINFLKESEKGSKEFVPTTLEAYKGKPIILHFWATWCGPCVEELPHFDKFVKDHQDDFHIITLTTERPEKGKPKAAQGEPTQKYFDEKSLENLSVNLDTNMTLTKAYQVIGLPTTIFFDSNGQELGRIAGAIEWQSQAGELIAEYLKSK